MGTVTSFPLLTIFRTMAGLSLSVGTCTDFFCRAVALKSKKASAVTAALENSTFKPYGAPDLLHSDNGREFCNWVSIQLSMLNNTSGSIRIVCQVQHATSTRETV